MKKILEGGRELGIYQKCLSFNRNCLKCPEILKRVVMGSADSQHRCLLIVYVDAVLKVFKRFNSLRV